MPTFFVPDAVDVAAAERRWALLNHNSQRTREEPEPLPHGQRIYEATYRHRDRWWDVRVGNPGTDANDIVVAIIAVGGTEDAPLIHIYTQRRYTLQGRGGIGPLMVRAEPGTVSTFDA